MYLTYVNAMHHIDWITAFYVFYTAAMIGGLNSVRKLWREGKGDPDKITRKRRL